MKIYGDVEKDIIRDELLNESSKYKLFITITSKDNNDLNWWELQMNKIKENLKIKYKVKEYFISIEKGQTLKKLHAHIILDIANLDYSWLHKLLNKNNCTCDIQTINDEHNLKDYITGGRDKDYKGWVHAMMHLSLYKSIKKRIDNFFEVSDYDENYENNPTEEIIVKKKPIYSDFDQVLRSIRGDNEAIKLDSKTVRELLKLIKNSEEEFLGFKIKTIDKVGPEFLERLKKVSIFVFYYRNKQIKLEELMFDNSMKKLNKKEEIYTFLTRIYKKFINSFVDYLKVLLSVLDETNELKKIIKTILLFKDRTIAMIVRHIIWIHVKYIIGTKISKKTIERRDFEIQNSQYDFNLGNVFSRWSRLWKGTHLLSANGQVNKDVITLLGSLLRDYIFTWLKPLMNVEKVNKKIHTRDNLYVQAFRFSINEEILKEFSYRLVAGGILYDKMPMLCMPKEWAHIKGSLSQNCTGGYLGNGNNFYYPLMSCEFGHDLEFNNSKLITAINYIQSIPFVLNKEFFKFLKEINIVDILSKTLYSFIKDEEMSALKIAKNKSNFQRLKDVKHIMDIATELEKYPCLWFPIKLDYRARIYTVSEYFNYQGHKLSRSMIDFFKKSTIDKKWFMLALATAYFGNLDMSEFKLYCQWKEKFEHVTTIQDVLEQQFWIKAKEPFLFLRLIWEYFRIYDWSEYQSGLCVYFDTSASGLLIISLLFGEQKYYKDLNLDKDIFYYLKGTLTSDVEGERHLLSQIGLKDQTKVDYVSDIKIGDIYSRIISEFVDEYTNVKYSDLENDLSKKIINDLIEQNLYNKMFLDSWALDRKNLRKLFKNIIMTMNYGLTHTGIFDKLYSLCVELNLYDKTIVEIQVLSTVFYNYVMNNVVLMKHIESFKKYVMNEYTKKHKPFVFKSTLRPRKIINNDFSVLNYDGDDYDIKMTIANRKFNKINFNRRATYKKTKEIDENGKPIWKYQLDKDGNKIEIPSNKYQFKEWIPDKINFTNHVNGIKPNFIHHFDALLLYNFIINLVDNNNKINIALVHDSFGISLSQYEHFIFNFRKALEFMFAEDEDWNIDDYDHVLDGQSWFMQIRNVVWPK